MDVETLELRLQDPDTAWSVFNGESEYGLKHVRFKSYENGHIWSATVEDEGSSKRFLITFENSLQGLPTFRIPLAPMKVVEVDSTGKAIKTHS